MEEIKDTDSAISYSLKILGLDGKITLKDYQSRCLDILLRTSHDIFVTQPTGSGKSLVYQMFPFAMEYIQAQRAEANPAGKQTKNIVLIVSPLISLMKDQITKLVHGFGLLAFNLSDTKDAQMREKLKNGEFTFVFGSPEAFLAKENREVLKSKIYKEKVVGVFIDESHCVAKWGINSAKSRAFRECYGKLAEIRSLLGPVPFVSLTATASKEVQSTITKSLSMLDYVYIGSCPNRNNIRYSVIKVNSGDMESNLCWLIDDLNEYGNKSSKCIVFCRSHKTVSRCYSTVLNSLREKAHIKREDGKRDYTTRIIAMFHSDTDQDVKEHILKSFSSHHGTVRVVFATIAFGMGVDCKGLKTVVHYGPPDDIDDYFQESGRAGRDTTDICHAVLILYPGCLSSSLVSPQMKLYCNNEHDCRRMLLLKKYMESSINFPTSKHDCCDICSRGCQSDSCDCLAKQMERCKCEIYFETCKVQTQESAIHSQLTSESEAIVRRELEKARQTFMESDPEVQGCDVSFGFPKKVIDEVVGCFFLLKSADAVWVNTSVLDWTICQHIFDLVQGLRNVIEISKVSDISLGYLSLSKPNDSDSTENDDSDLENFQIRTFSGTDSSSDNE